MPAVFMFRAEESRAVSKFLEKLDIAPVGTPLTVKRMLPAKPADGTVWIE
jgi:hypothetical protein